MKTAATIALVISTVIVIVIGGVIIHLLESDNEIATRTDVSRRLVAAVQQFLCVYSRPLVIR